jgi:hypothetical protein
LKTAWGFVKAFFAVAGAIQTLLWLGGSILVAAAASIIGDAIGLSWWELVLIVFGVTLVGSGLLLIAVANMPAHWWLFRKPVTAPAADPPPAPRNDSQPAPQAPAAAGSAPASARTQRPLSSALPSPVAALLGVTPGAKLSNLIEEGERLRTLLPAPINPESDNAAKENLVRVMLGWNIDYPAQVYEWESRVWRTITGDTILNQYRALYTYTAGKAQALNRLEAHLQARVGELRTILARV